MNLVLNELMPASITGGMNISTKPTKLTGAAMKASSILSSLDITNWI